MALFGGSALLLGRPAHAQLEITVAPSTDQLVELIEGFGVEVLNVTVFCDDMSYGSFTGESDLQMAEGLVLATGDAGCAANPALTFCATSTVYPGDPDVALLAGVTTFDACAIEFDCIPLGDTLLLNYSFGSEEYPNYTCSTVNDAFGLFLSGPGIQGPFSNGAVNIATVPGTDIPISINTVNAGSPSWPGDSVTCTAADPNWQANSVYFIDNVDGQTVAYDGMTVNLTAMAVVQSGETYHFKIAVADGGDAILDSGVFLEAFSYRSTGVSTGVTAAAPGALGIHHDGERTWLALPPTAQGSVQVFS
ncbi:MAG: choice-of-anchor L domain-containing protein, partial [Flavobacteriales bacterium]|nr:choice-of-anchor L domain-containing protein [Flavobacteriales bacterium]